MENSYYFVTDADRRRLGSLLTNGDSRAWGSRKRRSDLYSLLEEAEPIEPRAVPKTLVTMNTTVELEDTGSGSSRIVTLVYPEDEDLQPEGVSVLKPLGVALIGCQEGDAVQYTDESGNVSMRVKSILHQPEQACSWHL